MNINTLSKIESDYKSGHLPVALYSNNMVKDRNSRSKFYAMTITRGVCTDEDIANDIVVAGLNAGFSKEQILSIMMLARNAKLSRLAEGFVVDDGINKFRLKLNGSFESDTEDFSPEKHSIGISSHPTAAAMKVFEEIKPVIRKGNSKKPVITGVYDAKSKAESVLTRGGYLEIKGTNIRVLGDCEEVGLYFVNTEDSSKTVKLSASELGRNASTAIACVVPADLENVEYSIKIVTQFIGGKVCRKEPLEFTYGNFIVS